MRMEDNTETDWRNQKTTAPNMNLAIAGLLLNMLVFPGLGSILGGVKTGWYQASLFGILIYMGFVVNAPGLMYSKGRLLFLVIVMFAFISVWVWGMWTGVSMIRRANHCSRQKTNYESFGQ